MPGPAIIRTRLSEYFGGAAAEIHVTNGARVALSVVPEVGTPKHLGLSTEDAVTLAVAILNAAQNAHEGEWMGPTDSRKRALFALGVVADTNAEASDITAEAISERVVRDFAGHDDTPIIALSKLIERDNFRPADILWMIRRAVALARA